MKNRRIIVALTTLMFFVAGLAAAQTKIDSERMDRDIQIAENALSTLIKQQFKRRDMWLETKASYTPGFGVTMRLPGDNASWIYEFGSGKDRRAVIAPAGTNVIVVGGEEKDKAKREMSRDSARTAYYSAMIKASKDFLADYGDLISQLAPEEKIMITNRGDGGRYYDYHKAEKRQLVTVEATKGDMTALKQGRITRDQMIAKIKVVNTESTGEVETDLELLSSILGRLYRSDLSKTFYTDENIYYERLKDFGVIYYMQAYSGQEMNRRPNDKPSEGKIWLMPTQKLEGLTQQERDKKVTELYPQFEKDLKDNIVEYAQTVKSLKNEEMFVFNVNITKCQGCGIPANLELSIKTDNIRKVAAGGMSKADAVASMNVKKGQAQ